MYIRLSPHMTFFVSYVQVNLIQYLWQVSMYIRLSPHITFV